MRGEFVPVDLIERKAAEMGRIPVERDYPLPKALRKASSQWGEADRSPPQRASRRLRGEWVQLSSCAGWYARVEPRRLNIIVNTGDDEEFYGLHVSPDIDTVTYTLAGMSNTVTGWGLAGESFNTLDALARFYGKGWFALGDRDLATHLFRTERLKQGWPLSRITAEIARRCKVSARILPMSDDSRADLRQAARTPGAAVSGVLRAQSRPRSRRADRVARA